MTALARVHDRMRRRWTGYLAVVGSTLHALSIPVAMWLFKLIVQARVGRYVTWDELFKALERAGAIPALAAGISGQIVLASACGIAAYYLLDERDVALPVIGLGLIGMAYSFFVFGGILGAIGGAIVLIGGIVAYPIPASAFAPTPNANRQPPPLRPGNEAPGADATQHPPPPR